MIGKRHFMISFFRNNIAKNEQRPQSGWSLLFSILDPKTGQNRVVSQIDSKVQNAFVDLLKSEKNHDLDRDLLDVLLKEIELHGPPNPIRLKTATGDKSGKSLYIEWEDFLLRQRDGVFGIEFPLLEDDKNCSIQLYPESDLFSFDIGNGSGLDKDKVPYRCYPVLQLRGLVDGERITGQAWMDHQWDTQDWLVTRDKGNEILGWDWFGVNLDDGTNLIIILHRNAKTGEVFHSSTVFLKDGEQPVTLDHTAAEPTEFWESPDTHIKYPVSWKITNEYLELSLTFTPTVKNQEVPLFGLARSVWEGSGKVSGTLQGKSVKGRARAEFYGYGFIFDFQHYLERLAERIDQRIEEFFPKQMDEGVIRSFVGSPHWKNEPIAFTEMISKPVWDLILRSGKRWRPIFGILMQEALGKSSVNFERSWCLAELIHSGALIIDDIEDNSELRRGEPALHLKYGLDTALNAGNFLYFLPTVELFRHQYLTDIQKLRIHEIMMDTYLKAHFGQALDIYWSRNMSLRNLSVWFEDDIESKILQMYDYKTATAPKGLARVAAVLNGVSGEIEEAAVSFARAFAVAYQIIDDVHNFSNSPRWTKVCGEDITNGKLTFVIAKAITMLDEEKSNRFQKILCDENLRKEQSALDEAVELVRNSGALDACKKEAREMSNKAWNHFAKVVPSCEAKIMLHMLQRKMIDLVYDT